MKLVLLVSWFDKWVTWSLEKLRYFLGLAPDPLSLQMPHHSAILILGFLFLLSSELANYLPLPSMADNNPYHRQQTFITVLCKEELPLMPLLPMHINEKASCPFLNALI